MPPPKNLLTCALLMANYDLDCYFIPAVDEHLNLSVPAAKQRRAWISGFTGSAGDLLVGKNSAWLFVDSRYYEQAELQVDAGLIKISKLGLEGNLSLIATLEKLATESGQKSTKIRFGFDPFTVATEQYQNWLKKFATARIELVSIRENLADKVRQTAETLPAIDESPIFSLPVSLTGETCTQKLVRVREAMQKANIDVLPITNLNQIAWLFNLRGSDIPTHSYFYILRHSHGRCSVFVYQPRTSFTRNQARIIAGCNFASLRRLSVNFRSLCQFTEKSSGAIRL